VNSVGLLGFYAYMQSALDIAKFENMNGMTFIMGCPLVAGKIER
jgi:hypothetical protein